MQRYDTKCKKHAGMHIVMLCLTLLFSNLTNADSMSTQEGNLEQYLKNIGYGSSKDGSWVQPSQQYLDTFSSVFELFATEYFQQAHQLGVNIGVEVVQFNDINPSIGTHYILRETAALGQSSFIGVGTYVMRQSGHPVMIQAPHPKSDLYTELQAIELYLSSPSKFLALAGTRRNSSELYSECSGKYYESDASHNTHHTFFNAHEVIGTLDPDTVFIQLHGFGSSSLSKLQRQCSTDNDVLVNISVGKKYFPNSNSVNFIDLLETHINSDNLAYACIYGSDTKSLGGTTNTTGRFTNHSTDPCNKNATSASHRFIHIEQSYKLRSSHRQSVNDYYIKAINDYF